MIYRIVFWLLWPLIWIYAPLNRRVRVVIIKNGKILLVKNKFGPGKWQLPGGGIKFGESAVNAACREFKEELGIVGADVHELVGEFIVCKQVGLLMRLQFVQMNYVKEQDIIVNSREIAEYSWQHIDELRDVLTEVNMGITLVKSP